MKATNNGLPNLALPLESKKRLNAFQRQLASDRTKVQFDDRVLKVLLRYSKRPTYVNEVRDYLNNLVDADGYAFSRSLKQASKLHDAILAFQEPDYTSFRWNQNYQAALRKVKSEFASYHLVPLSYSSDDDIINALPKLDTHSGWTFILTGNRKKGENLDDVFSHWLQEEATARKQHTFGKPILPGVRTQGSGEFTDDGQFTHTCKHKTRLVSMIDFYQILAELRFAKPYQEIIITKDFYAGGKDPREINSIISNLRAHYSDYVSLDYSAFDQSISSWLIEDAFDVVKSAFRKLTDEEEEMWNIVVHDFIHKSFLSKDGLVFSHKGVPSGSMFTQIIDSLVNRIMIETFLFSYSIRGEMVIMGDDNLLYYTVPGKHEDIREVVANYLTKNFGVVCNESKSTHGPNLRYPQFLSREWRNGGEWRHPRVLISRMLFSERFRDYDSSDATPELVVYSYILAYKYGMEEFFDVRKFMKENKLNPEMLEKLGSKNMSWHMQQTIDTRGVKALCRGYVA